MSRTSTVGKNLNRAIRQLPLAGCAIISILVLALWAHSYLRGSRYLIISDSAGADYSTTKTVTILSSLGGLQVQADRLAGDNLNETHAHRFEQYRKLPATGYVSLRNPSYPSMRTVADESITYALGMQGTYINDRLEPGAVNRLRLGFTVPWWLVFVCFSSYPISRYVVTVIRRQQEDRLALGMCPRCGVPVDELITRCLGCNKHVAALVEA